MSRFMKIKSVLFAAAAMSCAVASVSQAQTQSSLTVKDGNSNTQTLCEVSSATGSVLVPCSDLYVQGAQVSGSNPVPTAPNPTENHLGEIGSHTITSVGTAFTNPTGTTSYVSTNEISNSATAGSVVAIAFPNACRVAGGSGMIRRGRLQATDSNFLGTIVRMHLHQTAPTYTNGDHATWLTTSSGYLGDIDITFNYSFSDGTQGAGSPNNGGEINYTCAAGSTTIYGELEARSTITQTAGGGTITPSLELIGN